MKDGFDKNVAEKMPKIQKVRPNRPWNVNPVQMPAAVNEEAETPFLDESHQDQPRLSIVAPIKEPQPEIPPTKSDKVDQKVPENVLHAEKTLKEIDSQFTSMIIENKETKRLLDRKDHDLEEALRSNSELNLKVNDLQAKIGKTDQLVREVDFLNEQLQDANLYIQGLISIVNEKETLLSENISARKDIEQRLEKMGTDLKDRAMLDVKSAILERELNAAHQRIKDLETLLVTEENKRKPLEDEIVELKSTLEKVHSSLAQIRLKAKREAYGL